ncbi:hypothetical protein LCGC14_2714420 [marine sediment metagenome]|uniref:Uncharacterized protein n=1 Tax=marine sediment metagenome TaxID=412755 RepID=A0A0F8ZZL6_9ZZZZ
MHDTDTNGGDLKAIIRIVPPGNKTNGADLDFVTILPPEDDDDDVAGFAAELGRRARRRMIELGEL